MINSDVQRRRAISTEWLCALCLLTLMILFASPRKVHGQWATNGNDIHNTNSGNVGIGTTTPVAPLNVTANNSTTGNALFRIDNSSATGQSPLDFFINGTLRGRVRSDFVGNLSFVANGGDHYFFTGGDFGVGTAAMLIKSSGNVGVGTSSPNQSLTVNGFNAGAFGNTAQIIGTAPSGTLQNQLNITSSADSWGLILGQNNSGASSTLYHCANCAHVVNVNNAALVFGTNNIDRMRIDAAGNVGIGTTSPSSKLHVVGDITVTGNIAAKYQDVAEWVPTREKLAPGTVVVLDPERGSDVVASFHAYDTKVAGVISAKPGLALGESGEDKVLVATTGRVRVKVDATRAPIRVGDLLVTSDTTGYAMKSEPIMINGRSIHSPGTLIGKALESLEKGTGEIMVLLSLQ